MIARVFAVMAAFAALSCARNATPIAHHAAAADDSDVAPPPTIADVKILRRTDELLADASAWNHFGDRTCDPGARSWNLFCALHRASLDVTGEFHHRSAALQEVRWVVEERTRGVELAHRLMDYNNLPTTTFVDIKNVLAEATRRVEAKVRHDPGAGIR